ncbi:alpha/beta hydrolase [Herbihabitans rhizosphaerae]|uniref:alpha/beta hydrolase n=1 Tax=Herbihabitans rhizosphaerae TaxID=1872711 RepID=UPI001F5EC1AE|nr:alpha/beta hydrolase [Herbihabitans rhizosphaerae]
MRITLIVLAALLLLVVTVLVLAYVFQRRLIYLPSGTPPPASSVLPGAREVTLTTHDGLRLGAWFIQSTVDGSPVVLMANGNGGNRSGRAPLAGELARRGLSVLLFDYRGYGGNPGDPTEQGLASDARAARQYLVGELGVPPNKIVYYGESLGTAVVTELATEHPPAALILRSPFTELAAVAEEHYPFLPVRTLLRDRFPLLEHLRKLRVPTTVIYGDTDSIVPTAQSRTVADTAPEPRRVVIVSGANHNDLALHQGPQVVDAVVTASR